MAVVGGGGGVGCNGADSVAIDCELLLWYWSRSMYCHVVLLL